MSTFKPTTRIPLYALTNRKNSPQDIHEMIKQNAQWDDEQGYWKKEEVPLPKHSVDNLKNSPGLRNLCKTILRECRP